MYQFCLPPYCLWGHRTSGSPQNMWWKGPNHNSPHPQWVGVCGLSLLKTLLWPVKGKKRESH